MLRVAVAAQWQARLASAGLEDPAVLLQPDAPRQLPGQWVALTKPGLGGRERWRWTLPAPDGAVLYVKRYTSTPLREQIDRVWRQSARHSRAWWEYQQSAELTRRFIPAVQAVTVAEDMCSLWESRSAVVFAALPGDAVDRLWPPLAECGAAIARAPARQQFVCCLARFVSAVHQAGVCHRDLYLCHVFAEIDPAARAAPRFTLLDLARTHRPTLRRLRWIIKDLSQLDFSACQIGGSRADRLRFLLAYLGLGTDSPRVRYYARRVVRKSTGILRRLARKSVRP